MSVSRRKRSFDARSLRWPALALVVVPVAPILKYGVAASPAWIFLAGAIAICVLADWIRRATEHAASTVGPAVGGLMNVSFGSLAELILALFVLTSGKVEVVKAQLAGSIIGTSLLGLGLAIVVGTIGRDRLTFRREHAGLLSSLLLLGVIALLLPEVFELTQRAVSGHVTRFSEEELSLGVAVVLLAVYAANLVYTLITHRDVFAAEEPRDTTGTWPLFASITVLVIATALVAAEAELVSGALQATAASLGLSDIFVGVVVLALVGTTADLLAALWFARSARMSLVLNICLGSAIQVALVVAPILVVVSWLRGEPMTLVFGSPLQLFAIISAAFTVNAIASDGEATWFEGVLLIGVYVLFGLAFFFVSPS